VSVLEVVGRLNEAPDGVATTIIHKSSISMIGNFVKNFVARCNEIIFAVEHDRDGLTLREHAARTCRVGMDDCGTLGTNYLDRDHIVIHNVHDPEKGSSDD
jgi:hypothetical protein